MMPAAASSAAPEIVEFLIGSYRNTEGVHSETIIGAAAALTGEFALRAVEPKLPESGWVMSEKAGGIVLGDHSKDIAGLWDFIREGAIKAGASEGKLPAPYEVVARVAKAVGGSPFPPISVPEKHFPHEWSPNACPRLRGGIEKIAAKHGLEGVAIAQALTLALINLIIQTAQVLPPEVAATLALEIMLGVTHMAPMKAPV